MISVLTWKNISVKFDWTAAKFLNSSVFTIMFFWYNTITCPVCAWYEDLYFFHLIKQVQMTILYFKLDPMVSAQYRLIDLVISAISFGLNERTNFTINLIKSSVRNVVPKRNILVFMSIENVILFTESEWESMGIYFGCLCLNTFWAKVREC